MSLNASHNYFDSNCFTPFLYYFIIPLDNTGKYQSCISCADPDYGVAINFPRYICAPYEPYGVAVYIFLQLVPVLIMMIVLAVFHINITNGNLNGYILYSQMVTLQFPELGYTGWVPSVGNNLNTFLYESLRNNSSSSVQYLESQFPHTLSISLFHSKCSHMLFFSNMLQLPVLCCSL